MDLISTLIISVSCPLDKFSRSPILDTFNDSMPGESHLTSIFKEAARVIYTELDHGSLLAMPARSYLVCGSQAILPSKTQNELPFNICVSLPQGNQTENLQVSHLLLPLTA